MSTHLTPGRWRGLKLASNRNAVFNILAFDQRGSYKKMLPGSSSYDDAVQIKQEVVVTLSYSVSAALLDNQYGLLPAMQMRGGCGLLLSLEESGYSGDATYRKLIFDDNWTVAKIKQMGGNAVKLLAYYHPGSGELAEEIEGVIAKVIADCHAHDLPLFLEPMSYSLDASVSKESAAFAETRPQVVIETARRLSKLKPDVLKMEMPHDAAYHSDQNAWRAACEQLSEVSDVPWVLLSAGVDFATFAEQTRIACAAGASGWLAGRAIWKECVVMSPEDRQTFLTNTAMARVDQLNEIADAHARKWTDFYTPPTGSNDWFKTYNA
ncbi:MAG: tagatose 1,6-diphosphate aldolase [Chloroflexota bacterium]|nr:tagatose 1,6-diphosphate aldolase [Chloroflexota bacterium]